MLQEIPFEDRKVQTWDEPPIQPLSLPFFRENAPYFPKARHPAAWYKALVLKNVLLQHEIAHLYFYQKRYGLCMASVFPLAEAFSQSEDMEDGLALFQKCFFMSGTPYGAYAVQAEGLSAMGTRVFEEVLSKDAFYRALYTEPATEDIRETRCFLVTPPLSGAAVPEKWKKTLNCLLEHRYFKKRGTINVSALKNEDLEREIAPYLCAIFEAVYLAAYDIEDGTGKKIYVKYLNWY